MNDKATKMEGYQANRPSWLNKQKSAMTYFHERLKEITPKWRQEAFYDLYDYKGIDGRDNYVGKKYSKSREIINRWYHSQEYQELCLVYSRAKYIGLLPQALKTVEGMLIDGAVKTKTRDERIRYQIAIDIIEKCKILEDQVVVKAGSEKGNTINVFNLDKTSEDEIKDKIKNVTKNIEVLAGG